MNALREALDRTILLMRDDLERELDDATLLNALTDTEIVLVGDARNLSSHAAQCAYVGAALLMQRSGHRVFLAAPDVPLTGPQPPLTGQGLVSALLEIGTDLLPGVRFSVHAPRTEMALSVVFGDSPPRYRTRRTIAVNASAWSAQLCSPFSSGPWQEERWPIGSLAAAGLASVEAFKVTMQGLRRFARNPAHFDEVFAFTEVASLQFAPADTPQITTLGNVDFLSGGAITNATLYALARLPGVSAQGRIIEPERSDLSNINRYAFLRHSAIGEMKADVLQALMPRGLVMEPVHTRYDGGTTERGDFAARVCVGVDDIPSRWKIQEQNPAWLGIGATSHWAAMASHHEPGFACARCLHPRDEPTTGPIPTIAFVTFFAGLELASYFLRAIGGVHIPSDDQCVYYTPLRPERLWRTRVARRNTCQLCGTSFNVRAA